MSRLTEYHCDVAVIKDKEKLSEAMAKLALYEDMEDQKKLKNGILIHAGVDGVFQEFMPFATVSYETEKDFAAFRKMLAKLNEKPKTNGDRIRNMTNEELTKIIQCPYDTAGTEDIMPCVLDEDEPEFVPYEECQKCMLNWLEKEVTADDQETKCPSDS